MAKIKEVKVLRNYGVNAYAVIGDDGKIINQLFNADKSFLEGYDEFSAKILVNDDYIYLGRNGYRTMSKGEYLINQIGEVRKIK